MANSFSEINLDLQIFLDATSIKAYQFCPRYYEYAHLRGYFGSAVDLEFGRLIADGLEQYQKARLDGKSREDALVEALRPVMEMTWNEDGTQWGGVYEDMWRCTGVTKYRNEKGNVAKCPYSHKGRWFPMDAPDVCGECGSLTEVENLYVPGNSKKNRQTLVRAIIWYAYDQPENLEDGWKPYVFPDGTKAVELSGKLPLPIKAYTGEQYVLTYHFDYIADFGGDHYVTDNKTTTKTLSDQYFDTYAPDTQFDTYDLIASVAYPDLGIKGVMVDAIQCMVEGNAYGKHPYYKNEAQREEHLNDLIWWIRQMEASAKEGYWPMNKRNCWLCPFKHVCRVPPKDREGILRANFEQRERWNPAEER